MPMEHYKEVAAHWFIKLSDNPRNAITKEEAGNAITREDAKQVYDEFVAKVPSVSSLRDSYTDKFVDRINDADFMCMMFLDGCFMLYFIQLFLDKPSDLLESSHLNRPLILRDMFLLENQIPYSVLVALKSLKPSLMPGKRRDDWAASFFKAVFLPPPSSVLPNFLLTPLWFLFVVLLVILYLADTAVVVAVCGVVAALLRWICCCWLSADSGSEEGTSRSAEPLHLLDLLRSELTGEGVELTGKAVELTGKGIDPSFHHPLQETRYWNYNFRPISELKAAGILVCASDSESLSLNNIEVKKGWIDSYLELPRIIIDDSTKTHLLNLAAYEMCPDGSLGQPVMTSYICFLDSLIYNADDVKELRSSNIMLNRLGNDEEVVKLFSELAKDLSPDYSVYRNVSDRMDAHFKRKFKRLRMWIGQFIRTHFTSPWTAISLIAAIFVILLTLVQTIYSVLSFYKIE